MYLRDRAVGVVGVHKYCLFFTLIELIDIVFCQQHSSLSLLLQLLF